MTTLENIFYTSQNTKDNDSPVLDISISFNNTPNSKRTSMNMDLAQSGEINKMIPKESNKKYIKIGEECSICLEKIFHKNNAFLTLCGHSFHKSCLALQHSKNYLDACCPLCREDYIYDNDICNRYNSTNGLDKLENFWYCIDYSVPLLCHSNFEHFIGTDKKCKYCITYFTL
jgi:hypothetical protein